MNADQLINLLFNETEKGIDYLKSNKSALEFKTRIGESPLHYCLIENKLELVKKLIEIGANVNTVEMSGATPLLHSVRINNLEMALLLVNNDASVDLKDNNGESVVSELVLNNIEDLFYIVLKKCKRPIQYYFSDLDAAEVCDNNKNKIRKFVIGLGLKNPFDN